MILILVPQTMEERVREAGCIPNSSRVWDVDGFSVYFCSGRNIDRSNALMVAGIAHNYALFDDTTIHPRRRGKIRFAHDGEARILASAYDETEFGLWRIQLSHCHNLTNEDIERLSWVLMDQQPWTDQEHNGNMYLMRKMLLQ